MTLYNFNDADGALQSVEADSRCQALEEVFGHRLMESTGVSNVSKTPTIIDIRDDMPVRRSNGKIGFNDIRYAVIHHEGVKRPAFYNSKNRYIQQASHHIRNGFGHIAYNFAIDNVGDIFYMSDIGEIGYHAGNYSINRQSIAIKFDGDLTTQKITAKQWKAYQELCVWLTTKRPDLPNLVKKSWRRHGDVRIGGTACPGTVNILDF